MFSSLLTKARNQFVTLHLRSGGRLAGKIIDFDDMFAEVLVRINDSTGEFATTKTDFESLQNGWRDDRILVNMSDISIVA